VLNWNTQQLEQLLSRPRPASHIEPSAAHQSSADLSLVSFELVSGHSLPVLHPDTVVLQQSQHVEKEGIVP
jgi:hypothetical protein